MDRPYDRSAQSAGLPAAIRRRQLESFASFRRQEITFIKLNLGVIAALVVVHLAFAHALGYAKAAVFMLLAARFAEQSLEWWLLHRHREALSPGTIWWYSRASPLAGILFAFALNVLSGMEDAHYHALMVIPIIASAFRFRLPWFLGFVTLAGALTVLAVLVINGAHGADAVGEMFEAVTIVLIYFVVGAVVWTMSEHLRKDSEVLRHNYNELTAMQARLLKDERLAAVGRLASAIAHEIRNPLAAISCSLAAAEGESLPAHVRREMARIAARETARLEKLTTDFLAYARVKPPDPRPADVTDAVQYVADLVTAKAAESSVVIKTACPNNLRTMMDEFQIHGALLNMAMNAIDASPPGACVTIGGGLCDPESAAPAMEMYVQNEGNPIPDELVQQIFEPFITTKSTGTGLGLAIARNVAVAHGGTLELTENRQDIIRFTLKIPFKPCPAAGTRAAIVAPQASRELSEPGACVGTNSEVA